MILSGCHICSSLLICTPSTFHPYSAFLDTLGELEGFLDTVSYDNFIITGDFNVDFCRDSSVKSLLLDLSLVMICVVWIGPFKIICYLLMSNHRSCIDHVMVSSSVSSTIDSVSRYDSGCTL